MFHHQKSSKSSDQNLQINLLQPKQRDSGIIIVRTHHNNVVLNTQKRRSAHTPLTRSYHHLHPQKNKQNKHQPQYQPQNQPENQIQKQKQSQSSGQINLYDNYQLQKVDFSQSLLTNPNQNNYVVGVILFILLVILTNTQTIILCGSQQILQIQTILVMTIFLCTCQLIAFGILYYCKWVQNINILFRYLQIKPRSTNQYISTSLIGYIALRPYLLIPILSILTIIWQFCYTYILLNNYQIIHLILFYTIILPDIIITLYFQQQLHKQKQKYIRILFYIILIYLIIIGFIQGGIIIIGIGIIGTALLYLGVRVGRMCLFVQYICKFVIFVVCIIIWLFVRNTQQQQQWQQPLYGYGYIYPQPPISSIYQPSIPTIIILILLSSISIIIVRCLNSKILRPQLYKYFYTDNSINNILLILPLIICYIYNSYIDIYISIIGCIGLAIIGYKIDRNQDNLQIGGNQGQQGNNGGDGRVDGKDGDKYDQYQYNNKSQQGNRRIKSRNKRYKINNQRKKDRSNNNVNVNVNSQKQKDITNIFKNKNQNLNQGIQLQQINSPLIK